ncbi:hypothetical protein PLESTB_000485800 [Pleodorina starrii]|uniref:Rieske domain-containing protein n=1 Tax=Pleodorina starrii TaxID=330485 RepID=A0A9W6EZP9_9CHLO|nr:hypothetical protein PLESTM_000357000 [Pleodorina starrii]GLC51283.1 hypothetical protein PLESTB_000485800 [Pleodorina starrii]GLC63643.1 hypothetical protein PLESTF_000058700 [Pleodorina starrii]
MRLNAARHVATLNHRGAQRGAGGVLPPTGAGFLGVQLARKHSAPLRPRGGVALRAATVSGAAAAPRVAVNGAPNEETRPPSADATASGSVAPTPTPEQQKSASAYIWERNWVPVCPLSSLVPSAPTPVVLLGQPLVVWRHSVRGWVVMRDVCPHRLAPLSEGRLEAGGTRLACSYHGWEFSEEGQCTRVPQLASNPRASATACASKRSCVTSFPTLELDGILFAWLDASEEGLQAARMAPKPRLQEAPVAVISPDWVINEMPADYPFWLEQSMDPTHANFLHDGVGGFVTANAMPLEGAHVKQVDLLRGFSWEHGAYEHTSKDAKGSREFQPPFITRVTYAYPTGSHFQLWIMSVPVRPGVTRSFFKAGYNPAPPSLPQGPQQTQQPVAGATPAAAAPAAQPADGNGNGHATAQAPAPSAAPASQQDGDGNGDGSRADVGRQVGVGGQRQASGRLRGFGKVPGRAPKVPAPHWRGPAPLEHLLFDQDALMLSRQDVLMRRGGLTARNYYLNSKADGGVAAMHVWLRQAGYPDSLWGGKPVVQYGTTYSGWPAQELSLEQILSRQERHVRHCTVCQRGLRQVTALCTALTAVAGLAAMVAATLAVMAVVKPAGALAAVGGWWGVAGGAVVAAALALVAVKGWWYREEKFISGAAQWRRRGGYALRGTKAK